MTTIPFDTLQYVKGAEAIGIKREHAEYHAECMAKMIDDTLATKKDLSALKQELIIKLGAMMIACSGLVIGALSFILKH
jgi:hypothetical protein